MVEEIQEGGVFCPPGKIGLRDRRHIDNTIFNCILFTQDVIIKFENPDTIR